MPKPRKPVPDFPLFPHNNGQWAKKIRGKLHYFGKWDDADAALNRYLDEKDYLLAGRTKPVEGGHSIVEVCDRFLDTKLFDLRVGDLAQRTWDDYKKNCALLRDIAGSQIVEEMMPDDFRKIRERLSEGVGTTTLGNRIRQARLALRHFKEMTGREPNWGKAFREPSAKAKRKHRSEVGERMHSAKEIQAAVKAAGNPQVKAMLYLGINCAFGNADCSKLTWEKLDLEDGWHNFERPKTYVPRRAKLWPEAVSLLAGLHEKSESKFVFQTKYGNAWTASAIGHEVAKVNITFYNLRRTFRTVADRTLETMAIRFVMGHAAAERDMDSRYIQRIEDERLVLVSEYVRAWLQG